MGLVAVEVAPGIVWLEVPEADVRVLCGCPADSVKHLMRRGLIRPAEVGGVACETGPNAILLSDLMIQNGAFCNLAEFPVMQMFYRQGMLLPGHPNNAGRRPKLIGRRDQVEAQMQYIYRGNYGLVSEDELRAAGVSADLARDMMRLKLRFAFGKIQHPAALLDGVVLDRDTVEIGGGVSVRRIALNVFEFAYGGACQLVDLNLSPTAAYECPFPLGTYQFRRDYFSVVHSGEGDGWDARRASMGSVIVFQGRIYLVDAGPNIDASLLALGIGVNEIEGIFHTHSHDDHFAGLTTLMQSDRRIKYFAVPPVRAAVAKKLCALLAIAEADFHCYFDVRDLALGEWQDVDGLDVKPVFSPHPVETTVFRFRALGDDGPRTYAHFADVVSLDVLDGMVTEAPEKPGLRRDWYQAIARDYAEAADIKKVDVGGGLIHGRAEDFRNDGSAKIILAHTSKPLSAEQRRIGSGASFGTVDVLISSHRDFLARAAYLHMRPYFPDVANDHLDALLNGPILVFNPETILLKAGQNHASIYLLLTGQVEVLHDDSDFRAVLSAGALLGEFTGLHDLPPKETCRAVSFVSVLEIRCAIYTAFVARHALLAGILNLRERREFLSTTRLLGGVVSTGTLNAIAKAMEKRQFASGEPVAVPSDQVGLIEGGRVRRRIGGADAETLGPGDFFGEEGAIFGKQPIGDLVARDAVTAYVVPATLLAGIPNVRWKLFEGYAHHSRL